MVEDALYVPAFNSVTLIPSAPLSAVVFEYAQAGNIYAWWQNDMPPGFGMDDLGPIYQLFASNQISKEAFIEQLANEIRTLAD
jgi:raffinose/stachyose/melibiose transport system substrate-binding protein